MPPYLVGSLCRAHGAVNIWRIAGLTQQNVANDLWKAASETLLMWDRKSGTVAPRASQARGEKPEHEQ
jgi:hypothetical protein